jgi:predicted amidohydrolase
MVIAEFGKAGVIAADIDLTESRVKRINSHNDVHGDRRTDLYRRTVLLD